MKVHVGVDADTGSVHTITGTSANMHDVSEVAKLIRDDDEVVYGDSGYLGAAKQNGIKNDKKKSMIEFHVNKPKYESDKWDEVETLMQQYCYPDTVQ